MKEKAISRVSGTEKEYVNELLFLLLLLLDERVDKERGEDKTRTRTHKRRVYANGVYATNRMKVKGKERTINKQSMIKY